MKKKLLTTFLLTCAITIYAQDQTTFILVRHAEKANDGTDNPPLTEAGLQRANDLAALLTNQEIDALYSTPFIRTETTLTPIGRDKGMEVKNYDPFAGAKWLSGALKKHAGGTIVICGHSNTIPELANALLGKERFQQFDDNDYSNLIIIVTSEVGKGKLVRLKF
ncbi:phosphoglycerate mutase family protein [Ekhidna sp.]|uniref:SixA phosphatase family protein n=1 Tax=Ekhidna sp. TaxID=2608089 RepID=UPI0032EC6AA2